MTISATDRAVHSSRLEHSLELYRDLAVALSGRITDLKTGAGDEDCKLSEAALKAHRRALQTVLEVEVSLAKRSNADGAGTMLDLNSARAEILARLAVWGAGR
jgi:DNA uptake protein ComE-like DNA-binding protein